jgi:hypothetical protein
MASQLGTLFTPGYDSTMQGLIGDENADQARGQQAMGQMQNQQLAQQELNQRANSDMQDYDLALRGMDMQRDESEKNRLQALMLDESGYKQSIELQKKANEFTSSQALLDREYKTAQYKKQERTQLELAIIQQKKEEAQLNGDIEQSKLLEAEGTRLRNQAATQAMAIGVADSLGGKSRTEINKFLGLTLQKMQEIERTFQANQGRVQGAIDQNKGRIASDRRDQAIGMARSFKLAHSTYMNSGTGAARLITPNLDGIESLDGLQFLRYNPAEAVGGNVFAMNPYGNKSTSAYGFSEMNVGEMNTAIQEHITTSTLDLIEQMGMTGIDRTAGVEAINLALQGKPEAEVIAALQKAKIDPVIFKGVTGGLAQTSEGEGTGGDKKAAREALRAAEAASGGEDTLALLAARINFKAINEYAAKYRKMSQSVVNVTDLPALAAMIASLSSVQISGKYEGLVDSGMSQVARLMPGEPDLVKGVVDARANELKSLTDRAQLGTSQIATQKELSDLESRRTRSKVEGDRRGASVARAELERLLRESDE